MKRLMKILLGLSVGAAIAVLFAPKSGRALRQQLIGGATSRLLPAAPVEFPETDGEYSWDGGAVTAVADEASGETLAYEEPAVLEEKPADEAVLGAFPVAAEAVVVESAVADDVVSEQLAAEEVAVAEEFAVPEGIAEAEIVAAEDLEPVAEMSAPEAPAFASAGAVAEQPAVADEGPAAEPVAAEPVIAPPLDLRSRIEETRAAIETDIAQPFASVADEQVVVEAEAAGPLPAEPIVAESVVEAPVVEAPAVVEPAVPESADEGLDYPEPVVVAEPEPVIEAPSEEPRAWEIPYNDEADGRQVVAPASADELVPPAPADASVVTPSDEPIVEVPAAQAPIAEAPLAEAPPAEAPPAEAPLAEAPPAEAPPAEAPLVEEAAEPVVEVPAAPAPIAEAPPAEAAAAPEPAAAAPEAGPVAREGGSIDQAEMRRRIEETRARLKAKAFDAMMSGESALLGRDSGASQVPKGDDIRLDGELESTIDESLSQEEY